MSGRKHAGLAIGLLGLVLATGCTAGGRTGAGQGAPASTAPGDELPKDYLETFSTSFTFDAGHATGSIAQLTDNQGALVGPKSEIQIATVGKVTALTDEQANAWGLREGFHAASGYEVLLMRTKDPARPAGQSSYTGDITDAAPVQLQIGTSTRMMQPLSANETLVVNVPTGTPAVLLDGDGGRTQSFDLRTGRRGSDAVRAYYLAHPSRVEAKAGVRLLGRLPGSLSAAGSLDLLPFTDAGGWLPAGRALLTLTWQMEPPWDIRLDLARSFAVKLPGGQTVRARSGAITVSHRNGLTAQYTASFAVSDTTTKGTLLFTPTSPAGSGNMSVSPVASGRVPFDLSWS